MTPNVFMTNEAWLEMVPKFFKGIHNMNVIHDHPYWCVLLSLNGFVLHANILETHIIFAGLNISMVKEEGNKSHVNQSHEHQVAKDDRKYMRSALDTVGSALNKKMDQWYLIVIDIKSQNQIKKE